MEKMALTKQLEDLRDENISIEWQMRRAKNKNAHRALEERYKVNDRSISRILRELSGL